MSALENSQPYHFEDDLFIVKFAESFKDLYEGWQEKANCRGVNPSLFYPERGVSTSQAKEVCAGCEVKEECLEAAVQKGEKFGIWGGLSERERRIIRQVRRLKAKKEEQEEASLGQVVNLG